jgi:hypothetical protein
VLAVASSSSLGAIATLAVGQSNRSCREHDRSDKTLDVSHGAGDVSSKSLISKMMLRSGVAKPPKFIKWQSPHACTLRPVLGVRDKSEAIKPADPR